MKLFLKQKVIIIMLRVL